MAQTDQFLGTNVKPNYAPRRGQAVDISSGDFAPNWVTRRIFIGSRGTLVAVMADDSVNAPVTFVDIPMGFHDLQIKTIIASGTTAGNMVALFG